MKNIAKSLAKFHEEMGTIQKDANNPFFKSKYAPLETILPAIKEPLAKSGLVFTQAPSSIVLYTQIGTGIVVVPSLKTTIIEIESGESISENTPLLLAKQDPQGQGSAITYMRRYALVSMLGLNCDEDDDGNHASGNTKASVNTPSEATKSPTTKESDKVCSLCGTNAKISPKSGKDYCPNWKDEKHKSGGYYKMIDKNSMTSEGYNGEPAINVDDQPF